VLSRLSGAIFRASLLVLLIATPSLVLPGTTADASTVVVLIALCAAIFTIIEYGSEYPSLVEFRDAPPFNRVRFCSLFVTVFALSVICRGKIAPSETTELVAAIGTLIGHSIDFPYSPVRLVVVMMPDVSSPELIDAVRTAAGISYLVSLISLAIFLIVLRLANWPARNGKFNVWVNLPIFDPTAGGDVVTRLTRDARINIALGFLLPFLIPMIIKMATSVFDPITMENPQTLIWTMTAWAFLPASLFMRGIAMGRVAQLIEEKRRRAYAEARADGVLNTSTA
jgi:hypothetical protein